MRIKSSIVISYSIICIWNDMELSKYQNIEYNLLVGYGHKHREKRHIDFSNI